MTNWPDAFGLRDVRCFKNLQQGNLRPITLLVGENSTGKSTFLGCYTAIHRMFSGHSSLHEQPNFNDSPFPMGSFREVVRTQRGRSGRIDEFQLELCGKSSNCNEKLVRVTFDEEGSQPNISALHFALDEKFLEFRRTKLNCITLIGINFEVRTDLPFESWRFIGNDMQIVKEFQVSPSIQTYVNSFISEWSGDDDPFSSELAHFLDPKIIALAPLRAQPKRTYDPVRETTSPEGVHVPMLMMRLARSAKNKWSKLHDQLISFGDASGLFSDIKVKGHGNHMSDPFQLQIKARSGSRANLQDVGYGVSQSLPILVDVINQTDTMFILQQPEVHLHPRGQAELATFFIDSVRTRNNRFLIETHSDYIIGRVQINVRQGLIPPQDVSILFFEPNGTAVTIHSMSLDGQGNLIGAPPGYREFFARETDRLLGFDD